MPGKVKIRHVGFRVGSHGVMAYVQGLYWDTMKKKRPHCTPTDTVTEPRRFLCLLYFQNRTEKRCKPHVLHQKLISSVVDDAFLSCTEIAFVPQIEQT